jgi:hypothetical protein
MDLNDNDMIVQGGTTEDDIWHDIAHARDGGAWDGVGLTSAAARPPESGSSDTALGELTGANYASYNGSTSFDGFAYSSGDVLVKYTYNGDAQLTGDVNFDDYVRTDVGFNTGATGWVNGDFNYSGAVDFDDYVLIDVSFNTQGGPL